VVGPLFSVLRRADTAVEPIVATAVHAGHDLRPEVAARIVLAERHRRREEDPYTDCLAAAAGTAVVCHRSRFEVDLNRSRETAVYEQPADAWGLDIWASPLDAELAERSRCLHDEFYEALAAVLDERARHGPFVLLDVHSYNHRRGGPHASVDAPETNPDLNVGTGSLDRARWGGLVERFVADAAAGAAPASGLDVRENVRFRGGHLASWVHRRYPAEGCALALEFKKVFMDEWTGAVDRHRLGGLRALLTTTFRGLRAELEART
jgi:N-formylglutamate amidohydrolase